MHNIFFDSFDAWFFTTLLAMKVEFLLASWLLWKTKFYWRRHVEMWFSTTPYFIEEDGRFSFLAFHRMFEDRARIFTILVNLLRVVSKALRSSVQQDYPFPPSFSLSHLLKRNQYHRSKYRYYGTAVLASLYKEQNFSYTRINISRNASAKKKKIK